MSKERKISVQNVTINEQKFIQVLIPDYENNDELLALPLSNSGNSYNYANTREAVGSLTVQVNAYVKKDTMVNLKAVKETEDWKNRVQQQQQETAQLAETVEKLSPLLENPNFAKLLENPALLDKLAKMKA